MTNWPDLGQAWRGAERWLLPPECLLCRFAISPAEGDPLVCALCRARWLRLPEPVCPRCGQPETPGLACRICLDWPAGFGPVQSAVWLADGARAAVHFLKYGGWPRIGESLAGAMTTLPLLAEGPTLVPVPLGRGRLRERGYNQCDSLADGIAGRVGATVLTDLLRRRRETQRQARLTPEARCSNVARAFVADRPFAETVVLVDDVFTTGATLVAAASALLEAGAERIAAVTFARARRPLDDDVARLSLT